MAHILVMECRLGAHRDILRRRAISVAKGGEAEVEGGRLSQRPTLVTLSGHPAEQAGA
jgi:hypothetical protein